VQRRYAPMPVCARVRQREGPLKQWLIPLPDDLRSEFSRSDEVLWKGDKEAERHGRLISFYSKYSLLKKKEK